MAKKQRTPEQLKTLEKVASSDSMEITDEDLAPVKPTHGRQRPANLETVSSGAGYWDFQKEPVFVGCCTGKFLAPKDIDNGGGKVTKKGSVIGYNFTEMEINEATGKYEPTGLETIISNSYTIDKDLKADNFSDKTIWWIEFVEKKIIKGKPFNVFYTAKVKA